MKGIARTAALQLLTMALVLAGATARAEERRFGSFEVHYSVFGASFLQPDIAAAYGVVRARDRALLNIAVRRGSGATARSVPARLTATASDLIRKTPLAFREIREQEAVYYIAEFGFVHGETLYFDVAILPEGESQTLRLEFSKVLYAD